MTIVYRYHCEPASSQDASALCHYIHLASDYRRELARIENRARSLLRCRPDDAMRAQIYAQQGIASRGARELAVSLGLHWGSYQNADEAHSDSCRSTKIYDDVRTFVPRDVGCVAVHLQPARPLADAKGWIRIVGAVRHGSEIDKSGRVRPARHHEVALRIGTMGDGTPLIATLHVRMHREIPSDAIVSWARVQRFKVGSRYRWELLVTVSIPARTGTGVAPAASGRAASVGVDIGWRQIDDRVRIATWVGSDGKSGEVTISNYVLGADAKADSLHAIRDAEKNEMRDRIRAWIAALPDRSTWIVEATTAMHAWLKMWRFVKLARQWAEQRIAGDEVIYEAVVAWLKHDRHLWDWEGAVRLRRKRQVDEVIRVLAVTLARQYDRIGIEAPFVAKVTKRQKRCEACSDAAMRCDACRGAERLRRLAATRVPHAAPARTRLELKTFAAKYAAVVIEIDPAYTTMDCASCGWRRSEIESWAPREIACPACLVTEDQDHTAARNLERIASVAVLGEEARTSTKKLGSRRTRKAPAVDRSQPVP